MSLTATASFTVTASWTCNYHTVGPITTEDDECNSNDFGVCSTYTFDGTDYFWRQSSA